MTSIARSDIFFFVTTIAVVLVSICIVIISVYIIQILKDLKTLSQKAKDESERISRAFSFLTSFFSFKKSPTKETGRKVSRKNEPEI